MGVLFYSSKICILKISLIPSMHICISVYTVSCNIARIAVILPEFWQNEFACEIQYCCNVAAILRETVAAILRQYIARRLVF